MKLCCEFAECEFESIDKMLRDNSFYAETYYAGNIIDNTFIDFLIRAKKSTYANSTIKNMIVENINVEGTRSTGYTYVAGLAGKANNSTIENIKIKGIEQEKKTQTA